MIIILEGVDGAGKTTLAAQIQHQMIHTWGEYSGDETSSVNYRHFGNYPWVTQYPRMYLEVMFAATANGGSGILDRSWLSEEPYGNAFRGGNLRFGHVECNILERMAMSVGGCVIWCDPGIDAAVTAFASRPELEYLDTVDQLKSVHAGYKTIMNHTHRQINLPIMKYHYKLQTVHDAMTFIRTAFMSANTKPCLSNAYGNQYADGIVIIAEDRLTEQLKTDHDPHITMPFMSFCPFSAPYMLTQQLISAGISERDVSWIHADDVEDDDISLMEESSVGVFYLHSGERKTNLNFELYQVLTEPPIKIPVDVKPGSWNREVISQGTLRILAARLDNRHSEI